MTTERQRRRSKERVVYLLAAILMIIRVHFWWWDEEMPMVLLGWISWPMIYQFGIWIAGYLLVWYTVKCIWVDRKSEDR